MSMLDTFIMRGEWIDNISTLPAEIQDKVLADIVRFGTGRPTLYDNDPIVFSLVNGYKGSMVNTTNDYKKKIEMSKSAGRKKKIDDKQIYELAKAGKTAQEVADSYLTDSSMSGSFEISEYTNTETHFDCDYVLYPEN